MMKLNKKRSIYWLNIVIIPLVSVIIGGCFNFFLPYFFRDEKGIQYSVEGPIKFYDSSTNGDIRISIDDIPIPYVYGYRLRLWNSGNCPLENLQLRSAFHTNNRNFKDFKIFSVNRDEKSEIHFGDIKKRETKTNIQSLTYKALNKGTPDTITFLTNDNPALEIISDSAGVNANSIIKIEENFFSNNKILTIITVLAIWVILIYFSCFITIRYIFKNYATYSRATSDIHKKRQESQNEADLAEKEAEEFKKRFANKISNLPEKE